MGRALKPTRPGHHLRREIAIRHFPCPAATKVELIVNLKTAKALGIDVPTSLLLLRADEVIE